MSLLGLVAVLMNLCLLIGLMVLWKKFYSLVGDDGRLRQGLQILQTKIAVLEDLSNRVDEQTHQFNRIFEAKKKHMEELIDLLEEKIHNLKQKSELITANGSELAEREMAVKLTRAAILAHKGCSAQEISQKLNLGLQEANLIVSLNHSSLQFKIDELPNWLQAQIQKDLSL